MIEEPSKAYQEWKSRHGNSYFDDDAGLRQLVYKDASGCTWTIDNIALKDFGETHYLSWTEEFVFYKKLIIQELRPHADRHLEWEISPSKFDCTFHINKWTEQGLFIVYQDSNSHYAVRVLINKSPYHFSLNVMELGEVICIKSNWLIGFKFYTDKTVSLFDLKTFTYPEPISEEEAIQRNIIPDESGENNEELD